MKIVDVKQNGRDWREWRGRGLGASEAPIIMGESPYQTPFELWLAKTGIRERPPANEFQVAAMKRGTELEPVARAIFENKMGAKFPALSAEHDDYEFIRASFDGINFDLKALVEIKCPGKDAHAKALKGQVPKYYMAQIQQQLMVSGMERCYYVSWDGKSSDVVVVEVLPDLEYQQVLLESVVEFWRKIQERELPEVSAKEVAALVANVEKDITNIVNALSVFKLLAEQKALA